MRIENLFLHRMKDLPKEAETSGHRLSLRGGYVHQTAAGIYTLSPLGLRVMKNIERIIRAELDAAGCLEISMPVLSPLALWRETGREDMDVLLKVKTRAGADMVFNPTHEEVVVDYARLSLQSYRQLPFCLYQIQTKYRDEPRARAGLIRCREFMMKDAYSFHATLEDLDKYYFKMLDIYARIYERVGLRGVVAVEAPGGDMSKDPSHEFQWISAIGEDTIYDCSACGYRANKEVLASAVCPKCGKDMSVVRGVEVGNIFRLATKYSAPMNLRFTDEKGAQQTPVMGCYGIGVSRLVGCLLEQSGSDSKAEWNAAVAPYPLHIITIGDAGRTAAEALYERFRDRAIIDATDARAGEKFALADLAGAPLRAILSDKTVAAGGAELNGEVMPLDRVEERIKDALAGL